MIYLFLHPKEAFTAAYQANANGKSLCQATVQIGILHRTLARYVLMRKAESGENLVSVGYRGNRQVLSPPLENDLTNYCSKAAKNVQGITRSEPQELAYLQHGSKQSMF